MSLLSLNSIYILNLLLLSCKLILSFKAMHLKSYAWKVISQTKILDVWFKFLNNEIR